jgi:hypothetical protein
MNKKEKNKTQKISFNAEYVNQMLKTIISAVQAGNELIKKEKKDD